MKSIHDPSLDVQRLLTAALVAKVGSAASCVISAAADPTITVSMGRLSQSVHAAAIDENTLFDLASLTKPMATAAIAMAMVSEGRILLDQAIDSGASTVAQLLTHSAGYPAHVAFFHDLWAQNRLVGRGESDIADEIVRCRSDLLLQAKQTKRVYEPGSQSTYSDVGYILLGDFLERTGEARLDVLFQRYVADPLQLPTAQFVDLTTSRRPSAVATEHCATRGLVQGEVHDENCHVAGGIMGHAGLFGTAADVARFAAAMIAALRATPMERVGRFRAEVVQSFFSDRHAPPNSSWRMGWDTPALVTNVSHAGDAWPRQGGFGHLGFTGTSVWLDLAHAGFVVLLTNRVHPRRENTAAMIKQLRRDIGDVAANWVQRPRG